MEEQDKILENITKSISDRLKIPIIVTYVSVLVIYNWDILFFLFFEDNTASLKIETIKAKYGNQYYCRIGVSLLIAIILIVVFTILNTLLNYCLKWFYRKDKEITSEVENFEQINLLTQQLSQSIDEIKTLNTRNNELQNINQKLTSKSLNMSIKDISKSDFERLMSYLNTFENKEKLLFSFNQLLVSLKNDINIRSSKIFNTATYEAEMEMLINILQERNLISTKSEQTSSNTWDESFVLSPSFKDFLEMEI